MISLEFQKISGFSLCCLLITLLIISCQSEEQSQISMSEISPSPILSLTQTPMLPTAKPSSTPIPTSTSSPRPIATATLNSIEIALSATPLPAIPTITPCSPPDLSNAVDSLFELNNFSMVIFLSHSNFGMMLITDLNYLITDDATEILSASTTVFPDGDAVNENKYDMHQLLIDDHLYVQSKDGEWLAYSGIEVKNLIVGLSILQTIADVVQGPLPPANAGINCGYRGQYDFAGVEIPNHEWLTTLANNTGFSADSATLNFTISQISSEPLHIINAFLGISSEDDQTIQINLGINQDDNLTASAMLFSLQEEKPDPTFKLDIPIVKEADIRLEGSDILVYYSEQDAFEIYNFYQSELQSLGWAILDEESNIVSTITILQKDEISLKLDIQEIETKTKVTISILPQVDQ